TNNTVYDNREYELFINHGGSILNGGEANPYNDISFEPTGDITGDNGKNYHFDQTNKILFSDTNVPVYVEIGDNYVADNIITASHNSLITPPDPDHKTFIFKTWKLLQEDIVSLLMGNDNNCTLLNNLKDGTTHQEISILLTSNNPVPYDIFKYNPNLMGEFGEYTEEYIYDLFFHKGKVKLQSNHINGLNINNLKYFKTGIEWGTKFHDNND
ncbi:MAG: hypothetical protein GQ534_07730, partial [Candidatus Delongbacteria bacterium]|nr:hypothetical protein [Candidatus Delongbacteria bacterium]